MSQSVSRRLFSLDCLKAAGMVYLIVLHVLVWLMVYADGAALVYDQAVGVLRAFSRTGGHVLGFGFAFWAGATFVLRWRRDPPQVSSMVVYPVFLVSLQILTNVLAWGLADALAWDVLSFMGVSMMLSGLCLWLGRWGWGIITAGTLGSLMLSGGPLPQEKGFVSIIVFGDPAGQHYWPLCPWYALFGTGMMTAALLASGRKGVKGMMILVGLFCFLCSLLRGDFFPRLELPNVWGSALFKPAPGFVIGIIGVNLALIGVMESAGDLSTILPDRLVRIVRTISRGVLMMYVCSLIFGYHLVWDVFYALRSWRFNEAMAAWPILSGITGLVSYQAARWWAGMKTRVLS